MEHRRLKALLVNVQFVVQQGPQILLGRPVFQTASLTISWCHSSPGRGLYTSHSYCHKPFHFLTDAHLKCGAIIWPITPACVLFLSRYAESALCLSSRLLMKLLNGIVLIIHSWSSAVKNDLQLNFLQMIVCVSLITLQNFFIYTLVSPKKYNHTWDNTATESWQNCSYLNHIRVTLWEVYIWKAGYDWKLMIAKIGNSKSTRIRN